VVIARLRVPTVVIARLRVPTVVIARLRVPTVVIARLRVPTVVIARLRVPAVTGVIVSPLTVPTMLGMVVPGLLVATTVINGPRGRRATRRRVIRGGHQRNRDAGTAQYGGRGEPHKCLLTAASHGHSSDRGNGTFGALSHVCH
jgi:hypothetical protein